MKTLQVIAQHGLDMNNERHQRIIGDEYAAHLAERPDENPGILGRIRDTVRAGLRKAGFVREWTDADVHALLRRSTAGLEQVKPDIRQNQIDKGARFADADDHSDDKYADDDPRKQLGKFGKTMEEQARSNKGYIASRMDWLKDHGGDLGRRGLLSVVPPRYFKDYIPHEVMPSLTDWQRMLDRMTGRRGQLMKEGHDLLTEGARWTSDNKRQAANLGELAHASTIGGVDPSRPYKARYNDGRVKADPLAAKAEATRQALHARLKKYYNENLDDKGRELYGRVRDHYQTMRRDVLAALEARIQATGATDADKAKLMATLRKTFEQGRVQGPYFPLQRYGDRWTVAKDANGETVSYAKHESRSSARDWRKNAEAQGYTTDGGTNDTGKSQMERIDPDFVRQVTELAANSKDPGLADEIWQSYLQAMPEMSMRKHMIHRQGRLGYTADMWRNLATNSFHGAHQQARLEYGHQLDSIVDRMKDEQRAIEQKDPDSSHAQWAPALRRAVSDQYDWVKNPQSGAIASWLTKAGFNYYLGFAPATAGRILSQNPMLALPILGSHHGMVRAGGALKKATSEFVMSRGGMKDALRGDERAAFENAEDQGMFSNTYAQTLAQGGNDSASVESPISQLQKISSAMFNASEHFNRMTTYMSAYRLAREDGMPHTGAMDHATDLTWDSHFDYSNQNRAKILRNDFGKVAGLFKQYSLNVTYRVARDFRDGVLRNPDASPERKAQALKAFGGMMGMLWTFAGVNGLPFKWGADAALNLALGDQDRPFDAKQAQMEYLTQHLGHFAATTIMKGPMSAITGAALSNGASYGDLWYRPSAQNESPQDTWRDLAMQFCGAIPAIGEQAAQGVGLWQQGNKERALEHFLPPEAMAIAKAVRYGTQGAQTLGGESIMNKDQVSGGDVARQLAGFTPEDISEQYEKNASFTNQKKTIEARKSFLENMLATAVQQGDTDTQAQVQEEIDRFNERNADNPGALIKNQGAAIRNRAKNAARAVNGVNTKGYEGLGQNLGIGEQ